MKLTLPRLITGITFLAIFAMAMRPAVDTDTWWHLRSGAWIVEHGTVPLTDVFSHTHAGQRWLGAAVGWLAQVSLYFVFSIFGYAGLNFFTAACVTLAFILIARICEGNAFVRAFTLILAAAASAIYWSARPQIISFLLASVFTYILYRYRWHRVNRLWLLPPLMLLWANIHGGFAIGFILIALTVAGQGVELIVGLAQHLGDWRHLPPQRSEAGLELARYRSSLPWLIVIGLLCAVAVCFNPAGPVMLLYPFQTVSISVLRDFIQEWQSPDFHLLNAQIFLWLLFGLFAVLALSPRRVNLTDLVLVAGVAYLGLLAWRNVTLLALVAPPLITRHLAGDRASAEGQVTATVLSPLPGRALLLNWLILLLVAFAAGIKILSATLPDVNQTAIAQVVPVGAAEFIRRERLPGPMFNAYNFGGYLAWALSPDYPVFVDGRTDLYAPDFLREYVLVTFGRPGYQAVLNKYQIKLAVVESDSLVSDALTRAGWRALYADALATVYVR